MRREGTGAAAACVAVLWAASGAAGQDTIVGSPHDLSVTGPGPIRALYEQQVCIFCHAPHNATGQRPLWNRYMPPTHYRIYRSSTTDARIDQPSGPSKMCLSCHDGALAVGLVASRPQTEPIVMTRRTIPPGPSDLTQDLSDDHPIGFRYDRALAFRDPQIRNPDVVTPELPLGAHREVHCTTCHDPHNNRLGNFLRITDRRSAICLACHQMHGWELSSHARSPAVVTGRAIDPRERLPYHTVSDNGCLSCHKIHSAPGRERLLRFRRQEENCLTCHNGSVARTNIESEVRKPSGHPVQRFERQHRPGEDPRLAPMHVECTDCHNPHAAQAQILRSPLAVTLGPVGPPLRGVSGVDRVGRAIPEARFEYEVCFKCHADNPSRPRRNVVPRMIVQTNTRLEFQPTNPSFHPVVGPRRNSDVVSLIPPLRVGSIIRCTDCHNSDQAGTGSVTLPLGPHGSVFSPLLIDNYSTRDFTTESPRAYALCYRCHDRQSILSDESFPLHSRHIVRGRSPCSACHDAHGIYSAQGTRRNNGSLINFDRSIVQPAMTAFGPQILYEDTGTFSGNCTLTCHGVVHVRFGYRR